MRCKSVAVGAMALLLMSGVALGQDGAGQPGGDQAVGSAPAQPPQPQAIPVPDLPVLERKELEGGLIIEELKIGEGYEVKPGGAVVAHYHGTLREGGTKFDSSFERGQPAGFSLSQVIQGWQKGVPGMKVGGIRRITIPYALAYGEAGRPPIIPERADLVFIVQLVDALQVEEVQVGSGDESASLRTVAVTAFTVRDESGKVVESATAENPMIWFPGEWQPMVLSLEGMKKGGKRTVRVPRDLNPAVQPGMLPPGRPSDAAVTIEVELLAFRNLPG